MSRTDDQRVADILDAVQKLAEIFAVGHSEFERDWKLQSAAERQLEIIGEAVGGLSRELTSRLPEKHVGLSKGMRTVLVHEYHRVDIEIVWQTISTDVPEFASALQSEAGAETARSSSDSVARQGFDARPAVPSDAPLCGAPTKSGKRCANPAPPRGQRCADGHRRL